MLKLPAKPLDALKELIGIGIGKASASLNELMGSRIELAVPSIVALRAGEFKESDVGLSGKLASVELSFSGSFTGSSMLAFPEESAEKLVAALINEEPGTASLHAAMSGTLSEVGNITINGVMGSIGNYSINPVTYSLPNYMEGELIELLKIDDMPADHKIILAKSTFIVQDLQIEGSMFIVFEVCPFDNTL